MAGWLVLDLFALLTLVHKDPAFRAISQLSPQWLGSEAA
jgi:hypothetical protein